MVEEGAARPSVRTRSHVWLGDVPLEVISPQGSRESTGYSTVFQRDAGQQGALADLL